MLLPTHTFHISHSYLHTPLTNLFSQVFPFKMFSSNSSFKKKKKVLRGFGCVHFPKISIQIYRNQFLEDNRTKKILELLAEDGSDKLKMQAYGSSGGS